MKKGFTLVELLMVIAIISLLSTVVVGSLSSARGKGRIAAGQQFSHSLKNSLGDHLVGEWTFNDDTVTDVSGNSHDGTLEGGVNVASFVDGVMSKAVTFDATTKDYIDFGDSEELNLTNKFTFEIWVKPGAGQNKCFDGSSGNYGLAGKVDAAEGTTNWSWQLRFGSADDCGLGFQFNQSGGGTKWITSKRALNEGEWYHVAGTFNGVDINFYLNGVLTDTNTLNGIVGYQNKLLIGNAGWGGSNTYFTGTVDDTRIYDTALSLVEIQKHYAESLEKHFLVMD